VCMCMCVCVGIFFCVSCCGNVCVMMSAKCIQLSNKLILLSVYIISCNICDVLILSNNNGCSVADQWLDWIIQNQ
jgi:hypothetical protein